MTRQEFITEITQNVANFDKNIGGLSVLKFKCDTYADWHRMFTKWCEVGTEMEKEYYPPTARKPASVQTLTVGKYGEVVFVQQDSCYIPSGEKDGLKFTMFWEHPNYRITVAKRNEKLSDKHVSIMDQVDTILVPTGHAKA